MKLLVFGADGMVGSRFIELLPKEFHALTPSVKELDITKFQELKSYIDKANPEAIINFAAITDVDFCETQRGDKDGLVWRVNALACQNIAKAAGKNIYVVQISTDMVFSGNKKDPGPYKENHPRSKEAEVAWYGFSKAQGEVYLHTETNKCAVVRIISPVRAQFEPKLDYLRKILYLYDSGKLYPMFSDQRISITFIDEFSKIVTLILNEKLKGTFHVCSRNTTSPYELANYLLVKARNVRDELVKGSYSDVVKDKRRYPQFSGLNTTLTQQKVAMKFSTWQEIVDKL